MKKTNFYFYCYCLFVSICVACNPFNNNSNTQQTTTMTPAQKKVYDKTDKHSFAKPQDAVMQHLSLDIEVNFKEKTIAGKATCIIRNINKTNKLYLDTKGLQIEKVLLGQQPTTFKIGEEKPFVGQALEIDIFSNTDSVTVFYKTSPEAEALQWLSPQQTADKKQPFMFTQSQAILARTWVPCQDSPAIRFTYDANVKVPNGLLALMSADNPTEKNPQGKYQFKMNKPIPAYLLALAVGDFAFKSLSPRTGVYAEPSMLNKAAKEFDDMEAMTAAAENLYGKYDWGRYDVLVMPPSFPFGGMENPKLTFATPTIITGDKSLVSLVAHELAHSWSGNLVTNATWEDFWLNEGFTVYFERRIMAAISGKPYSDMLELIGLQDLQEEVKNMNNGEATKLKLDLTDKNPDDGVTHIAYEKGYFFLRTIEEAVGREKFDAFVKKYFATFAYKSINTEEFLDYLNENLLNGLPEAKAKIQAEQWIYNVGIPENCPKIASERFLQVDRSIAAWLNGTTLAHIKTQTADWSSHEWLRFIRNLPEDITVEQLKELDKYFQFTASNNDEIACVWLTLAGKKSYEPAYYAIDRFLTQVGRRKFVVPVYHALYTNKDEKAKNWALQTYKKARGNYHFLTVNTLDRLLRPE